MEENSPPSGQGLCQLIMQAMARRQGARPKNRGAEPPAEAAAAYVSTQLSNV
jgi:hypothetical protein